MRQPFLEGGQIVNTHGVKGEVKLVSWCDTPEFLAKIPTYYIDGAPFRVRSARVHQGNVLALLEGVDNVDAAMKLKGRTVLLRREDAALPDGQDFLADLIGLDALNADTGEKLGVLTDVLFPSAQTVYVVSGAREILIPAVDEFITEINVDSGYIKVRMIEGM